jgi:hypothetical protein
MNPKCPACLNEIELCDCFTSNLEPLEVIDEDNEPKEGIKTHGQGGYSKGCRCQVCSQAKREYMLGYKKDRH